MVKKLNQLSFFEIENRREELETKLRAEGFPVTMAEMAQRAEEMHNVYQKTKEELKPEDIKRFNLEMMEDKTQRKAKMNRLDSPSGQEFVLPFYDNSRNEKLTTKNYEEILQKVWRRSHYKAIDGLKKIQQEKPWLIELSERFIETFGATFVGNGHRCIKGYEGLNFLDGIENTEKSSSYTSAVQLPATDEKNFVNSIENVTCLGKLPTFEKEISGEKKIWNHDFYGWKDHTEAFIFTFKNRKPMIGYMNRSFAKHPYIGEAWILFSEKKATEYLAQNPKK